MPGVRIVALSSAILTLIGGLAPVASVISPSDTLLPNTTRGFVSISNVKTMVEHWNKTQLGQLAKDPVMKPFIDDLRMQIEERWSDIHEKLGVTIDDLRGVAGGELSIAAVQTADGRPALAIVVDVTGNLPNAKALLEKISKNLTGLKALHERIQLEGVPVDAFRFPPDEFTRLPKEGVSKPPKGKPKAKPAEPPDRYALYGLKGNLLVGSSQREVIQGILARAAGKKAPSLAEVASYQAVMKRCGEDAGKAVPQIRWYVQPLGYLQIMHVLRAETQPVRKGTNVTEFFKEQGFDALQGLGGFVDFAAKPYEVVHRTAVYAPGKYEQSMKLLSFPNSPKAGDPKPGEDQFKPQPWIPAEVASYATFQFDVLNAFDNLDPLVDALFGKGEKGVWQDLLGGLERDPNGPKIGLRKELILHLGSRVTVVTDYQLPITTTSERLLFAVETKPGEEKAVADAVTKLYKNDREMRRREFEGHVIWESIPPEKSKSEVPEYSVELPPLPGAKKAVRPGRGGKREHVVFPNLSVTAAHGQLLVASHYDYLAKVLGKEEARIKSGDLLSQSVEYQQVTKALEQFGVKAKCARGFAKTDEQYRATYELIRQNKMPESETMLGRILNAVIGSGKKGVPRKQEIDGSKLPDFDFVRRYLGPGGFQATSEKGPFQGWFIKGFVLPKGGS